MSDIHQVVRSKDWDEVRSRLGSIDRHDQFSSGNFDDDGSNAFHIACGMPDVPFDIVSKMFFIDQEVLTRVTYDDNGFSPLHIACESGSALTVRTILSLEPDVDKLKEHAVKQDTSGSSPLWLVWSSKLFCSWTLNFGNAPTDEGVSDLLQHLDEVSSVDDLDLDNDAREMWDKTLALLIAVSTGSLAPVGNGNPWTALHTLADRGYNCSNIAFWLGLKLYPSQVKWANEDGDLPLHIAAAWGGQCTPDGFETSNDTTRAILSRADRSPIQLLVECYPDAAKMRGELERLPLHYLADSNSVWETEIKPLLQACPEAINSRDPVSHLYPFMQRAVHDDDVDEPEVTDDDPDDSTRSTNAVYMLLRKNPDHVKGGILKTAYEEYLEKKAETYKQEALGYKEDAKKAKEHERSLAEKEAQLKELRLQLKKRKAVS